MKDFVSEMSTPRRNLTLREKTQQAKEIKDILMSSAKMDNNESLASSALAKKLMTLNNPLPTSIIRIVPGDVKNRLVARKSTTKQLIVQKPMKIIPVSTKSNPSTSSSAQLMDHCYLKKLKFEKPNKENANELNEEAEDEDFSELIQFNDTESETSNNEIKSNISKRTLATSASAIPEKIQKIHSEHCCCSCRDTVDLILQQQQEILKILRKDYPNWKKLDLLPNMPFDDMNDFLDFDESLTNENVRDQFMVKMRKFLVSTDQKSVSNIMSCIVTNELCRNISWIGVKNSLAFGTTNMVEMIIDIIQEHHNLDIDTVKTRIAEWLRRCGDRIGNEIRKNKKRAELGYAT